MPATRDRVDRNVEKSLGRPRQIEKPSVVNFNRKIVVLARGVHNQRRWPCAVYSCILAIASALIKASTIVHADAAKTILVYLSCVIHACVVDANCPLAYPEVEIVTLLLFGIRKLGEEG